MPTSFNRRCRLIEGLRRLLEERAQAGLPELCKLLGELLGESSKDGRLLGVQQLLHSQILRLRFEIAGSLCSLVVKQFRPDKARCEQAVLRRWLPAVGLAQVGPALLGDTGEVSGGRVWHVYEDLGDWMLNKRGFTKDELGVAVARIAQIHTRFSGHAFLGEGRTIGGERGMEFYGSCVRHARQNLEALKGQTPQQQALCERLLQRMVQLQLEEPLRAQHMAEYGGPPTLLHGDLWTGNVLVIPAGDGFEARLIDWDHAGVGPITFDLSAFLLRFSAPDRAWILQRYQEAIEPLGWQLPVAAQLNRLLDTAWQASMASEIRWLAEAGLEADGGWVFAELAEAESWYQRFGGPMLLGSV